VPVPILLLPVVWPAVVVVGAVVTGWSRPSLVGPAVLLTTGALGPAMHHGRLPRTRGGPTLSSVPTA
jgi:hypothetical protein